MAEESQTLTDLSQLGAVAEAEAPAPVEPKIDAQGRAYATGRRKNAVARVWIKRGNGTLTVNGREGKVGHVPGTLAQQPLDGLQVGQDTNGGVGDYTTPFQLQGRVDSVVIEVAIPSRGGS